MTNNNLLPLTPDTLAAIIALEYLTHRDDHSEFIDDTNDTIDSIAELLADDLDDLYHNGNFDIYTPYFFTLTADNADAHDTALYDMLSTNDTITERAAQIIHTATHRDDPFAAFR